MNMTFIGSSFICGIQCCGYSSDQTKLSISSPFLVSKEMEKY
jgi:hypothetical protein